MKKRRIARLDEFGDEECNVFRDAVQNRVKEAASFSGLVLEPSPDINDCNLPDQANFYLSFQLPVPGSDEELDVEASVTHNPYMTLQFYLRVGEDEEEEYEVDLENGNHEAMMDVIGDAFNKGWSPRTGSDVIWAALEPFLPADGIPEGRFSSYSTETSSPMFRNTGELELELEISDEIAEDDHMMGLVDLAYEMATNKNRTPIDWEAMADYLEAIYYKHGNFPEQAEPADWDLVARSVRERAMEKPIQKTGEVHPLDDEDFPQPNDGYITDTGQSSWNFDLKVYKKKLGGPYRSLNEATQAFEQWAEENQSFMALWFVDDGGGMNSVDYNISSGHHKEGLATESPFPPPPKRRLMKREEGERTLDEPLDEGIIDWLEAEGAPFQLYRHQYYDGVQFVYLQWPDQNSLIEWEDRLEDAGYTVHRGYWERLEWSETAWVSEVEISTSSNTGRSHMHREEGSPMQREEGAVKSKKKLFTWLDEQGAPWEYHSNETYGRKSMIYIQWPDMEARKEWENRLEDDGGFKTNRRYWPGNPVSEVQVSYFKGHHWDE